MSKSTRTSSDLPDEFLFCIWLNNQDQVAFKILVDRTHDDAWFYASAMLKSMYPFKESAELPDDIVQEAFLKLSRYPQKIDNFKAFLFITIQRIILDLFRKSKRRPPVDGTDKLQNISGNEFNNFEFEDTFDQLLAGLTPDQTASFKLFLEDLSYEEIASEQNKSEGQVRGHIFRARKHLRDISPNFF
jgi:RNA polymerase sigma factor (sigma-70 family)